MANNDIKTLADAVNLQVAAEAFWGELENRNKPDAILKQGNKNNSRLPNAIIGKFKGSTGGEPSDKRFSMVAHVELSGNSDTVNAAGIGAVGNKSGLSATLFCDADSGKYTLSIRSTEFADSIKDPLDVTADLNLAGDGWAFAQILSLEQFWNSLLDGSIADGSKGVSIGDPDRLAAFRSRGNRVTGAMGDPGCSKDGAEIEFDLARFGSGVSASAIFKQDAMESY